MSKGGQIGLFGVCFVLDEQNERKQTEVKLA
jgi:hypothetical protein